MSYREGDNRSELRLAAATEVGFDAQNLQMLWPHLGQGSVKQDLATTLLTVIFATFHVTIVQ